MSNRIVGPVAKELIAAKARIENPENWCRGAFQLNDRMCALGALGIVSHGSLPALRRSSKDLFGLAVVQVNDYLGHAAVMQLYDHAINRALNEGI